VDDGVVFLHTRLQSVAVLNARVVVPFGFSSCDDR